MADDPPAGQHPVRGHDHVRPRGARDGLRGLDVVGDDLVRVVERRLARAQERRRLLVVVVRMVAVDVGRLRGHRRIEVQRQERDLAALDQPIELPDDLLGAADRKRRDEQDAAGIGDHLDRLGQDPDGLGFGIVLAAAVGRFDEHVVRLGHRRRVAQDRGARPAEVAREDDHAFRAAFLLRDAHTDDRRAEDMAGIDERGMDARRDLDLLAVAERLELDEGGFGVLGGVQRRVQVDLELRGLRSQLGLRVARPGRRRGRRGGRGRCRRRDRGRRGGPRSSRGRVAMGVAASAVGEVPRSMPPARARRSRRRGPARAPPRTRPPGGGRRRRPCRGGASPSVRLVSRTPRGACPSRAGRASPARSCRPSRGSVRGSRT